MLNQLQVTDFTPLIGHAFIIRGSGIDDLECTLIEANTLGAPPPEGSEIRHSFSIILRGPDQPILAQQIARVSNEHLGDLEIFLVPLGPDGQGIRYEAVFT